MMSKCSWLNRSSGEVKPYRVLVVDDEDSVRASIARFLKSRGYEAVTEDSGAAALARLSHEHFDIMLCDIRMASLFGLDVLSHALPLDNELAVVVLSAGQQAATGPGAPSPGAVDFLVQPGGIAGP